MPRAFLFLENRRPAKGPGEAIEEVTNVAQMMIVTEAASARRLMKSLRAKKIAVSQLGEEGNSSARPRVRLLVRVPGYRLRETYEILAAGG